ncbi:MAG: AAA family ATPase, partial [Chitinophagaceae bacterium]|nr:AAA family ATPase [Chitinophagaceae bacterium]
MIFARQQQFHGAEHLSFFLWGARQTGKSTLLKTLFPQSIYIDLLQSQVFRRYNQFPELLRERLLAENPAYPVIIDEIQKVPALLNEIHWLIENTPFRFILSGSSPRKLLRGGVNLLGGRALRYELYPLSYSEIPDFDLLRAFHHGLLPKIYLSSHYEQLIDAYVGSYLSDEIVSETRIRRLDVFSRFLEKAIFSNGSIVNYTNIAADCGVSSNTVKEYFQILQDMLWGTFIEPYQKKPKRRIVVSPRFYFFDVGIANFLMKQRKIEPGTEAFGRSLEHFIFHELRTYAHYSGKKYPIYFWRTSSGLETDFILGENEVAIEVKGADFIH